MHWGFHLCCCQSHLPEPQALEREAQGQLGEDRARAKMAAWQGPSETFQSPFTDCGLRLGQGREQGTTEAEPELKSPTPAL